MDVIIAGFLSTAFVMFLMFGAHWHGRAYGQWVGKKNVEKLKDRTRVVWDESEKALVVYFFGPEKMKGGAHARWGSISYYTDRDILWSVEERATKFIKVQTIKPEELAAAMARLYDFIEGSDVLVN